MDTPEGLSKKQSQRQALAFASNLESDFAPVAARPSGAEAQYPEQPGSGTTESLALPRYGNG